MGVKPAAASAVLGTLLAIAGGCDKTEQQKKGATARPAPDPVAVTLAQSALRPVQRTVDVFGTLYGNEEATISAKVSGRVTKVLKDVGDPAAAGQPLVQIDPTDYELSRSQKEAAVKQALAKLGLTEMPGKDFDPAKVPTVERARLGMENAFSRFNRAKELVSNGGGAISQQAYTDAKSEYDIARSEYDVAMLAAREAVVEAQAKLADVAMANQQLADTTVRAPAAAKTYAVAARMVSVGEYVREDTNVMRLVASDPIKFRPSVPERYQAQIKVGQKVRLSVYAFPDMTFDGAVSRISPQVDMTNRTFQIEVLVPNPNGLLQPGAFARGAVLTDVDTNVTLVPKDAVVSFAGVYKVFGVEAGKAKEYEVETGVTSGDFVEITKGFEGARPVVVTNASKLASGTPVTLREPAERTAAAAAPTTKPAVAETRDSSG